MRLKDTCEHNSNLRLTLNFDVRVEHGKNQGLACRRCQNVCQMFCERLYLIQNVARYFRARLLCRVCSRMKTPEIQARATMIARVIHTTCNESA